MNITIVGTGYVGLSNAMLFSKKNTITALDIDTNKVDLLNNRISPIRDNLIQEYLTEAQNFNATTNLVKALSNADIVIIATPTNYDENNHFFDTSSIIEVLNNLNNLHSKALIVIKSTIPVGFTEKVSQDFPKLKIIFSPEFLREGKALYDNLYPSRIIIGDIGKHGEIIADLYKNACLKKEVPVLLLSSTEAEAVKLFSNTYLAMRIAYFNELDSYCEIKHLNTKSIIDAVGLDPRIGNHYNNPSFGYGGYCLPKDTKQLLANYDGIPQNLISAIISSNSTRKDFITKQILKTKPNIVGIYRLAMKEGSDNFRKSAIQSIMNKLVVDYNIKIIIYEPALSEPTFKDNAVINDLETFKNMSDIIVANRLNTELEDVSNKVYSRDLYRID